MPSRNEHGVVKNIECQSTKGLRKQNKVLDRVWNLNKVLLGWLMLALRKKPAGLSVYMPVPSTSCQCQLQDGPLRHVVPKRFGALIAHKKERAELRLS